MVILSTSNGVDAVCRPIFVFVLFYGEGLTQQAPIHVRGQRFVHIPAHSVLVGEKVRVFPWMNNPHFDKMCPHLHSDDGSDQCTVHRVSE